MVVRRQREPDLDERLQEDNMDVLRMLVYKQETDMLAVKIKNSEQELNF